MLHTRQYLALGRLETLYFVGNHRAWNVLQPLEHLTEEFLSRFRIASALDQDIQDVVVLIDGSPQIVTLTFIGIKIGIF